MDPRILKYYNRELQFVREMGGEFSKEFPEPPGLFTIEEFGGWDTVATEFFDPENGSIAEVERSLGVATE